MDILRLTLFLESTSTVSLSTLRTVSASFFITASYNRRSFLSTGKQKIFSFFNKNRPSLKIFERNVYFFRKQAPPLLISYRKYSTYILLSFQQFYYSFLNGWMDGSPISTFLYVLHFLSGIPLLNIIFLILHRTRDERRQDRSCSKFVHLIKTRKKVVNLIYKSGYSQVWMEGIRWKVKGKTDAPCIISFSYLLLAVFWFNVSPSIASLIFRGEGVFLISSLSTIFSYFLQLALHLDSRHVRLLNLKIKRPFFYSYHLLLRHRSWIIIFTFT